MFQVEQRGTVGVLRIDDGRVNAMGPSWVQGFPKAFREAAKGTRPVVILGNAKALSAGLDLKTLPTLSPEELVDFTRGFMSAFREVLAHPRPVIVGVDGAAIAGGSVLSLAADFRIGTVRAKMGVTEVPVGIPFPGPVLELVRARLPPQEATEAILRGTVRVGDECLARGWVDKIVDPNSLRDACIQLADDLGAHSPLAYGMAKAQLNGALVQSFEAFEKDGAEAWAKLLHHDETLEGLMRTLARLAKK